MSQQAPRVSLLKFGKKCYMEEFRKGILYMNELDYFITFEENCKLRNDVEEGLTAIYQAKGGGVFRKDGKGESAYLGTITDRLRYRENYSMTQNIFCMYALQIQPTKQSVDKRNLKFGDTFIFISDPSEFLDRVKFTAEKEGIKIFHKLVEYVDPEEYSGHLGPFRKFSEFSYQNEFRILVCQELPGHYKLDIGDISNITEQGVLTLQNLNSLSLRI
jgi:hypothetical protein